MIDYLRLAAIKIPADGVLPAGSNLDTALPNTIKFLLGLIGSLAVMFMIVGAIMLATSSGSPSRIQRGRETLIYAIVGLIFAIGAFAVVSFIGGHL